MSYYITIPQDKPNVGVLELPHTPILVCYRGSQAHGTYIPPEDECSVDDIDIFAVCLPPLDHYFGIHRFDGKEYWQGSLDIVVYSLDKFLHLLLKGNPNILGTLWTRREDFLYIDPLVGEELIKIRTLFLGKRTVVAAFSGYAKSQFKKMTTFSSEGYMGEKRRALVAKFGYDVKNASHLIRLLTMCVELLETNEIKVFRDVDAQLFIDIKRGVWSLEEVKSKATFLFERIDHLYNRSSLREAPQKELVNRLVTNIVMKYYTSASAIYYHE
jgi:uncharacterized protein